MKRYFIFLLLSALCLHSQEIKNKEEFRKCKKQYSKKTCLSDEDQDGIFFYLDKCPKESGFSEIKGCPWPDNDGDGVIDKEDGCPNEKGDAENNGCPWPDTDGDGIPDKDDACPAVPGVPEANGCASDHCKEFFEKEDEILKEFKQKHTREKEKFEALRMVIFNSIPKELFPKNNISVSIHTSTFINDNISNCVSMSTLGFSKSLFLDQLFWTKDTFDYAAKKLKKNLFPTYDFGRMPINNVLLNDYKQEGYYNFIEKFPQASEPARNVMVYYYRGNKQKAEFHPYNTRLKVDFGLYANKDIVIVEIRNIPRGHYFYTFSYIGNQWKLTKKETQNH